MSGTRRTVLQTEYDSSWVRFEHWLDTRHGLEPDRAGSRHGCRSMPLLAGPCRARRRNPASFLGSVSYCGPEGRMFESCWARHEMMRRLGRLRLGRFRLHTPPNREGPYRAVWSRRGRHSLHARAMQQTQSWRRSSDAVGSSGPGQRPSARDPQIPLLRFTASTSTPPERIFSSASCFTAAHSSRR